MTDADSLLSDLRQGHERFLALVAEVRPELHRYCTRMTGSTADGEDIVQETLARAFYALSEMEELPSLRPWLFRVAHQRAIDHLRGHEQRFARPLAVIDEAPDPALDPEDALAREQAVCAAVDRFTDLAPAQRSCVILKDVLGHSLEEIAELLELSLPAVKAALHRGRERLRAASPSATPDSPHRPSPVVARYAALFNARDWDAVGALLAEEVRLDLVSRVQRTGRRRVANYFSRYGVVDDWHLVPAWLEGREVIAVFRRPDDPLPGYFIELSLAGDQITHIRDFRYVPYIARDARFVLSS